QTQARKEGWNPGDEAYEKYLQHNPNAVKARDLQAKLEEVLNSDDLTALRDLIVDQGIADPESGSKNWADVRQFNLMFKTQLGATADSAMDLYLRPETAQGIFVNYLNVQKTSRQKLPFGIAQIGKAFRNEIVARQFIFRMREFEQMEMQYFIKPGTQMEWFKYWKEARMKWHQALGLPADRLRYHEHEKLAHYADGAEDIQFKFPIGFKEMEGIHSRTDFDLSQHQEFSGRKLTYFDPETQERYVPYVLETSVGLDRTFLAHLSNAYTEEEVPNAKGGMDTRVVLKLHPLLAPYKAAVFPIVKKDGLPEQARKIMNLLKADHLVMYDEKDAIGRRYRRHDAIGTPYCITVDHDTLEDQQVTVRDRDTMEQVRIPIEQVPSYISQKLSWASVLL
ncbi:MAG: glycine--tRNA ligase, partial [Bacteroidota bacterium]